MSYDVNQNDEMADFDSNLSQMYRENFMISTNASSLCENCRSVFASIWILLIFTGILGNGLIIFSIIKYNKLTNVTQCYLFHLAITDISFIISCVPLTTYAYLFETWHFGLVVCKAYHYLSFVTVCATCLTLMMMTIDRYIYICNTRQSAWRSPIHVLFVSCLIWIVSFVLSVPNLITYDVDIQYYEKDNSIEQYVECVQKKQHFLNSFSQWYSMIVSYIIPSTVLIVSYIKILAFMASRARHLAKLSAFNGRVSMNRNRRVTKTVILLTLTFIISWFPVHFLATWYRLDSNFPQHFVFYVLKMIAHTLTYSNATVNPIIYAFSNESVRTVVASLLRWLKCKNSHRDSDAHVVDNRRPRNLGDELSGSLI